MPTRLKKLIGTVILIVLVLFYALVAMAVATATLAEASGWVHLLYFLVTGLLWVVPAMFLIKWMETPSRAEAEARARTERQRRV
ncbi:DUF2842 domain-containing protein [Antarcticirhabdus aurantiaca]|uniref:DUF2842 domain-containing protein n=1 Tax=Antarcticirhabdus aurantiaca TaxID=2606717 RepID=A0ACD4NHG7_9HYPH|nr:DUF2842 domain-containing protein [Antarcticirhabdus aurantiaca]WAJ26257.1 DUF2842 domain-containing protein [Jeongeuplla avenae]